MFVEYDPSFAVYRFRFGASTFTDWRGVRSLPSLDDVRGLLEQSGCKLGPKSDTRTWPIVCPAPRGWDSVTS